MAAKRPFSRVFRISLRTSLVLVLIGGLTFSWIGAKRRHSIRQTEALTALGIDRPMPKKHFGGYSDIGSRRTKSYLERYGNHPTVMYNSGPLGSRQPKAQFLPDWLRQITGEECFHRIVSIHLAGRNEVTQADISRLARFRDLRSLNLDEAGLDDETAIQLVKLIALKNLCVGGTRITDNGLTAIAQMKQLQELELWCTSVSDAGIEKLGNLAALKRLNLCRTQVTSRGVNRLNKALPGCVIWWDGCETFQLIDKATYDLNPSPADLVRVVNHLHGLGKTRAIESLREYGLVNRARLFFIVMLLFQPKKHSQANSKMLFGSESNWPPCCIAIQGDIPFTVPLEPSGSMIFRILLDGADWAAEHGELRKRPLRPADDPFGQATIMHARLLDEITDDAERIALKKDLTDQAKTMVSHLELPDATKAKFRWNEKRQKYELRTVSDPAM